jgi:hypothetical protein
LEYLEQLILVEELVLVAVQILLDQLEVVEELVDQE